MTWPAYGVVGTCYTGSWTILVDGHFRAVESLDEAVEATEDELFDAKPGHDENMQRKSFQLQKSLVLLRRITLPIREVVDRLLRQDLGIVPEPDGAVLPRHLRPRHPGHIRTENRSRPGDHDR